MFTDIVGSTSLVEAVGNEAWMTLLHWHDQALPAQFAKHAGQEIDNTGDGFFVAVEHSEPRTVTLKGMSEPASVVTVVWNDSQI